MAKKLSDEKREIVRAARESGASFKEAAELAGCSESTARKICAEAKDKPLSEEDEAADNEGKAAFVKDAWEIVLRSVRLLNKRLMLAEENCDLIMEAIREEVYCEGADSREANKLLYALQKAVKELTQPSIKEIAGVISTMYDRAKTAEGNRNLAEEDGVVKIYE